MPRLIPGERGAAAVEFALVLPILLASLAMVMATALRMFYGGLAEYEARTVARTAGLHTTISPASPYPDATAASRLALCGQGATTVPGTAYNPATDCSVVKLPNVAAPSEGDVVSVTLTYRVSAIQGLVGWLPAGIVDGLSVIRASASVYRE